MPEWKKLIFVNAICAQMRMEGRTAEEIIQDYPKLTTEEKAEILSEINTQWVYFMPYFIFKKREQTIAEVYVILIIKSVKTLNQVPAIIQPKVKAVLEALDFGEFVQ